MKKTFLLAAVLWTACVPMARATTITFSGIPTARTVVDSSLSTVTNASSLVLAGAFANESFSLNSTLSLSANVSAVMAAGGWEQFGLDTTTGTPNIGVTSTLGISPGGKIRNSVTDNNPGATKAEFFDGKPLYLWVFNAATIGAATQVGIFRAPSGATQPWTFATNDGGVSDSRTYSTASDTTPILQAIGGFGSTTSSQLRLTDQFNLAPIPEPSTAVFGLLTALAMLSSRKRRK